MGKLIDLSSQRFGDWFVIAKLPPKQMPGYSVAANGKVRKQQTMWQCKCICGFVGTVRGYDLRSGRSNGCGCRGGRRGRAAGPLGEPIELTYTTEIE